MFPFSFLFSKGVMSFGTIEVELKHIKGGGHWRGLSELIWIIGICFLRPSIQNSTSEGEEGEKDWKVGVWEDERWSQRNA